LFLFPMLRGSVPLLPELLHIVVSLSFLPSSLCEMQPCFCP
jgi:hypothetical protein